MPTASSWSHQFTLSINLFHSTAIMGGLMKEERGCINQPRERKPFLSALHSPEVTALCREETLMPSTPPWLPPPSSPPRKAGQSHGFSTGYGGRGSAPGSTQIAHATLETYFSCLPWLPAPRKRGTLPQRRG